MNNPQRLLLVLLCFFTLHSSGQGTFSLPQYNADRVRYTQKADRLHGYGNSVLFQGGFLLLFGVVNYAKTAYPDLNISI